MNKLTLKAARINVGLTQKEAAKRIGISVDTLGNYERGQSFPDVPVILLIERVYGVPYNRLNFFNSNLRLIRKLADISRE